MGEVKCLPLKVKVKVLHRIWAGEKVARVAHECGISRQVIYTWKRKAEKAIYGALEEKRRGPKLHSLSGSRKTHQSQEKKKEPSRSPNSISTHRINSSQKNNGEKRVERCPVCGCEKIYRNGTYIKKNQNNGRREEVVQRYICVWCKNSFTNLKRSA